MNESHTAAVLALPPIQHQHYPTNLIRQVVCEVRFPTIYDLPSDRPPAAFGSALRKEYVNVSSFQDIAVESSKFNGTPGHELSDKKGRWKVTLRPSTLTLETAKYEDFDEFRARVLAVWAAANSTIDSEFFTRIGLRYINTVPYDPQTIGNWVRPELAALFGQPIGAVTEYMTKIVGPTEFGGGYILHSGLVKNLKRNEIEFSLDFDLFKEDVAVSEAPALLDVLHDWEYRLFRWSLGPSATEHLFGAP